MTSQELRDTISRKLENSIKRKNENKEAALEYLLDIVVEKYRLMLKTMDRVINIEKNI